MKKLLVVSVLAASLAFAGIANAGIAVGAGFSSWGGIFGANVDIGLDGPLSVQAQVGLLPMTVGGGVVYRFAPIMEGKITPYVGGEFDYWFNYFGFSINYMVFGGKGGAEYKISDNLIGYGGVLVGYGMWPGTTYLGSPGGMASGVEVGVRFVIGQ